MTRTAAPFPYVGGKARIAELVWSRIGSVDTYAEPFAGSLAVLFGAPTAAAVEVVGDVDGHITNVWRSLTWAPDEVATWATWPPSSIDLRARRVWLVERRALLTEQLLADPLYHDAQAAGWWLWGKGLWSPPSWPELPPTQHDATMKLHAFGMGVHGLRVRERLPEVFGELSARLRHVRIHQGDWRECVRRWVGPANGVRGVFLDPPYHARSGRHHHLYAVDDLHVAEDVAAWALERGDDPCWRIVLCGLADEHDMQGWERITWDDRTGETIWCSPHCVGVRQLALV